MKNKDNLKTTSLSKLTLKMAAGLSSVLYWVLQQLYCSRLTTGIRSIRLRRN